MQYLKYFMEVKLWDVLVDQVMVSDVNGSSFWLSFSSAAATMDPVASQICLTIAL